MWKKHFFSVPKQAFLQRFAVCNTKPTVGPQQAGDKSDNSELAVTKDYLSNTHRNAAIEVRERISSKRENASSKSSNVSFNLCCIQVATISAVLGWRKLFSNADSPTKNKSKTSLPNLFRLYKLVCPSPTPGRLLAVLPLSNTSKAVQQTEKDTSSEADVAETIDSASSFNVTVNTCALWTQNMLGVKFASLKEHGKAVALFEKACNAGLASAQFNMGLCYESGYGVPADLERAAQYYSQAANQKHAGAIYNLAGFYFQGVGGLPQSREMGMALLEEAAQLGLKQAQTYLGLHYSDESTGQRNFSKSHQLFLQAASQKDLDAQYYLGVCYEKGVGTTRNLEEAFKWYSLAAQSGHVTATFNLGVFYEYGLGGLTPDREKAIQCYRIAAEAGDQDAQHNLQLLEESKTDIATHNILMSLISHLKLSEPVDVPNTVERKLPRHSSSPGGLESLGEKDDLMQNSTSSINTVSRSSDIQLAY